MPGDQLKHAIILTAGHATRAAPLSDHIAKPLFPLGASCGLDYAIEACQRARLQPIVMTGETHPQVSAYLNRVHPGTPTVRIESPSPNLLETVAEARNRVPEEHFLWMGGAVFFEDLSELGRLLDSHRDSWPFCTLFRQTRTRYKPKLVFNGERLTEFVVGDHATPYSAPTVFAVSRDFFDYAGSYGEQDVFQAAIDDGRPFRVLDLVGWSIEIHTVDDYYEVSRRRLPEGFISSGSSVGGSQLRGSYIYDSEVLGSTVAESIVLRSRLRNRRMKKCVVFEDEVVFTASGCSGADLDES